MDLLSYSLLIGLGGLIGDFYSKSGHGSMLIVETGRHYSFRWNLWSSYCQFTTDELRQVPATIKNVFAKEVDYMTALNQLVDIADKARRERSAKLEESTRGNRQLILCPNLQLVIGLAPIRN